MHLPAYPCGLPIPPAGCGRTQIEELAGVPLDYGAADLAWLRGRRRLANSGSQGSGIGCGGGALIAGTCGPAAMQQQQRPKQQQKQEQPSHRRQTRVEVLACMPRFGPGADLDLVGGRRHFATAGGAVLPVPRRSASADDVTRARSPAFVELELQGSRQLVGRISRDMKAKQRKNSPHAVGDVAASIAAVAVDGDGWAAEMNAAVERPTPRGAANGGRKPFEAALLDTPPSTPSSPGALETNVPGLRLGACTRARRKHVDLDSSIGSTDDVTTMAGSENSQASVDSMFSQSLGAARVLQGANAAKVGGIALQEAMQEAFRDNLDLAWAALSIKLNLPQPPVVCEGKIARGGAQVAPGGRATARRSSGSLQATAATAGAR
mmetsp:Transcript_37524/g.99020  ORF Transcript_37524/g.99020 Transcript_37524/m.99020 type:complete len:379 (-) Transcript_37524:309-1445(-)